MKKLTVAESAEQCCKKCSMIFLPAVIAAIFCFMLSTVVFAAEAKPLYLDPKAPVEQRVEDLLKRMTLEEKIGQMTQIDIEAYNNPKESHVSIDEAKFRKFVREFKVGSFLNGIAVPPERWYDYSMKLQKINFEESRLKIPVIYGVDHVHGTNYLAGGTIFPQSFNIACSFNDELATKMGKITALESADLNHHWDFAPILDIAVNPYWSRVYETFGEEPLLAVNMGTRYIKALQGEKGIAPYKLTACAKHYLGYSYPRSGYDRSPADIPDQYLYEIFVPSFKSAIDAGVMTVMVNSAEINGVPVHASKRILTDLLRNELGFKGVVVSDWTDIINLYTTRKVARSEKEATKLAIDAGIDMSMTPNTTMFCVYLRELVKEGAISEARIDDSVRRILRLKFELGLFEHPYPRKDRFNRIGCAEHKQANLQAARESIVLLKNNNNVLPLTNVKSILVVGPSANSKRNLGGGWTLGWLGRPENEYPANMPTVYTAIKKQFANADVQLLEKTGAAGTPERAKFDEMAKKADAIVVAFGEEPYAEGEGQINDLNLPVEQYDMIRTIQGTGKINILVYIGGRPRLLSPVSDKADAIIFAGLPGFEGATALAEILSGAVNPSAKLSISYPSTPGHCIPYHHKPSDKSTAQYPFGYGLSYTTFSYSDLQIKGLSDGKVQPNGKFEAVVKVTNTGKTAGKEAVLWYLTDEVGRITRPVKRLHHYEKISLNPGESKTVTFVIDAGKELSYPDEHGKPVMEDGFFTLLVGDKTARFELTGTGN
ncbi:MAG: glycoside hydrolase family 3 C-terminal domain-containing protein [Firmicutes bacterium]|nr:glycoside hydrolase family 3 C-terminal domain-containing protein [Bacillota bacterium]